MSLEELQERWDKYRAEQLAKLGVKEEEDKNEDCERG